MRKSLAEFTLFFSQHIKVLCTARTLIFSRGTYQLKESKGYSQNRQNDKGTNYCSNFKISQTKYSTLYSKDYSEEKIPPISHSIPLQSYLVPKHITFWKMTSGFGFDFVKALWLHKQIVCIYAVVYYFSSNFLIYWSCICISWE